MEYSYGGCITSYISILMRALASMTLLYPAFRAISQAEARRLREFITEKHCLLLCMAAYLSHTNLDFC